MSLLDCNHESIVGYSACWHSQIMAIHAHRLGNDFKDDRKFYQTWMTKRRAAVWLHLPMDEGEFIAEVWKRPNQYPGQELIVSSLVKFYISPDTI